MTIRTTFLSTLALGVSALALAGCQLDSTATLRASEILYVAQSGTPVPVNATVTGDFVTEAWCKDEGRLWVRAWLEGKTKGRSRRGKMGRYSRGRDRRCDGRSETEGS